MPSERLPVIAQTTRARVEGGWIARVQCLGPDAWLFDRREFKVGSSRPIDVPIM